MILLQNTSLSRFHRGLRFADGRLTLFAGYLGLSQEIETKSWELTFNLEYVEADSPQLRGTGLEP